MISSTVSRIRGGFRWYAVVTHLGRETAAKARLEAQGFHVYLPMLPPVGKGRPWRPARPRPMFPRYLFVSVDLTQPGWRAIHSTLGVADVLSSGQGESRRPLAVRNGYIEALQNREVYGLVALAEREPEIDCPYQSGDRVRIKVGPWADLEAIFKERVDQKRVALLVSLLGRDSRVLVDKAALG